MRDDDENDDDDDDDDDDEYDDDEGQQGRERLLNPSFKGIIATKVDFAWKLIFKAPFWFYASAINTSELCSV